LAAVISRFGYLDDLAAAVGVEFGVEHSLLLIGGRPADSIVR
jgi:hypothetical protein